MTIFGRTLVPGGAVAREANMHRQRVAAALRHETPDRCPWQSTFTPEFAERLRNELALGGVPGAHNPHGGGNPYDLEIALDEDILITSVGWANSYYGEGDTYRDEWGVGWKSVPYETPYGVGHYTEPPEYDSALQEVVGTKLGKRKAEVEVRNRGSFYKTWVFLLRKVDGAWLIDGRQADGRRMRL